jgi:hypothetical protein
LLFACGAHQKEATMSPRYRVTITKDERYELEALTKKGKIEARRFKHARALLLFDAGPEGPEWKVADVANTLGVTNRSIKHLQLKLSVEEGLEAALKRIPTLTCPAWQHRKAGQQMKTRFAL